MNEINKNAFHSLETIKIIKYILDILNIFLNYMHFVK